jgi:cephalosporin-C deacetylase
MLFWRNIFPPDGLDDMTTLTEAKPRDFDGYWHAVLDELAALPPAPEVVEMPLRSTDFAAAYGVKLTSIGPYRIFGYLSIPKGAGPFPARYYLPRYGSVTDLVPQGSANGQRQQYVTFSICVRGQRLADEPYAASFPGLLTDGIDDPATYRYRGIVADCVRGAEYLTNLPEVDSSRVAAIGPDLALTTAALCQQVGHVICGPALFFATADLASRTQAYPLEEVNDYLRLYSERREKVHHTLSYFDLRWFAPSVKATTLLMAGSQGTALDARGLETLGTAIQGACELHESEHSGYRDGVFSEQWLTRQFGLAQPSLPPHWQP